MSYAKVRRELTKRNREWQRFVRAVIKSGRLAKPGPSVGFDLTPMIDRRPSRASTDDNDALSPEALAGLREGLASARTKPPVYLGTFSQYADDE